MPISKIMAIVNSLMTILTVIFAVWTINLIWRGK